MRAIPNVVLERFVHVWSEWDLIRDVSTALTCTEVEALVGVFRDCGAGDLADRWISFHARQDEPDDEHYGLPYPPDLSKTHGP